MKTYLFGYEYDGRQFCLQIDAESADDATCRLIALAETILESEQVRDLIDGELIETIPATDEDEEWARERPALLN